MLNGQDSLKLCTLATSVAASESSPEGPWPRVSHQNLRTELRLGLLRVAELKNGALEVSGHMGEGAKVNET